jgi:hypothetical protein
MASAANNFAHFGGWFWLGLAPVLLALPGYRIRGADLAERMLALWPPAVLVVYLALDRTWFYHSFGGLSLPLAILAVRGWRRLELPRLAGAAVALALLGPGLVWTVQQLAKTRAEHFFSTGESRALAYLEHAAGHGAVLASVMPLGQAVPGFTDRQTYVGHYYWTPDYPHRAAETGALFAGRLGPRAAVALVRGSGASFLASACQHRSVDLRVLLGRLVVRTRRFGCATVYELSSSGLQAHTSDTSWPRRGTSTA